MTLFPHPLFSASISNIPALSCLWHTPAAQAHAFSYAQKASRNPPAPDPQSYKFPDLSTVYRSIFRQTKDAPLEGSTISRNFLRKQGVHQIRLFEIPSHFSEQTVRRNPDIDRKSERFFDFTAQLLANASGSPYILPKFSNSAHASSMLYGITAIRIASQITRADGSTVPHKLRSPALRQLAPDISDVRLPEALLL